jgi:exopolysaccharide biosynthesis predicted pyruvyltransferase EpsI
MSEPGEPMAPVSAADLRAALRAAIRATLEPLIGRGTRCALLNYPNNANAGDSAIWLGERALLAELGAEIVYECEWRSYSSAALAEALDGDTVVLLHGGGNFGDLYGGQQSVREQVLEEFRGVPVIQLPESIHFRKRRNLRRMRRLVNSHGSFTLLVRENQSLARAAEWFDVPLHLCPDMALALEPPAAGAPPEADLAWLVQSVRKERTCAPPPPGEPGTIVFDWPTEYRAGVSDIAAASDALLERMRRNETERRTLWPELAATFEPLARDRVEAAVAALARGRVLVTERLHGQILALLHGTPNVSLDYNYGKTRSFHETWTHRWDGALMATSAAEAATLARELL